MKAIFKKGDEKHYRVEVTTSDVAAFSGEQVHPVCATFSLAREIEWSSRLFVLEMKEDDEEGIGTMLTIEHHAPALVGDWLEITAKVETLIGNELICSYKVKVNNRLVASGKTGQKILKKEKIERLFETLKNG